MLPALSGSAFVTLTAPVPTRLLNFSVFAQTPHTTLSTLRLTSNLEGEPWPCDVPPVGYDLKTLLRPGLETDTESLAGIGSIEQKTWTPPQGYVPRSSSIHSDLLNPKPVWKPYEGYDPKNRKFIEDNNLDHLGYKKVSPRWTPYPGYDPSKRRTIVHHDNDSFSNFFVL